MIPQAADGVSAPHIPREVSIAFDLGGLRELRRAVATIACAHGLGWTADVLVLVVHEIAANAIIHGGGCGHLRMWVEPGQVRCRVTDHGPGFPAGHRGPTTPPSSSAIGGRGLWLAHQFGQVDIRTGPRGTTVDLTIPTPASAPILGEPSDRPRRTHRGHPR